MANIARLHEDVEDTKAALEVMAAAGQRIQLQLRNHATLALTPQQLRDTIASQAVLCAAGQRLMTSLGEPGLARFIDVLTITEVVLLAGIAKYRQLGGVLPEKEATTVAMVMTTIES